MMLVIIFLLVMVVGAVGLVNGEPVLGLVLIALGLYFFHYFLGVDYVTLWSEVLAR